MLYCTILCLLYACTSTKKIDNKRKIRENSGGGTHRERGSSSDIIRPPARTPEGRENQLIAAAIDLAERQILEGTASSQIITHYLKLGSTKERLEQEKLRKENELLKAKTEALKSAKRVEELYSDALNAMRIYSGQTKQDIEIDEK